MTHLDADTFTIIPFPELPDSRAAITLHHRRDGRANQLDLGDPDGPGTGLLTRIG